MVFTIKFLGFPVDFPLNRSNKISTTISSRFFRGSGDCPEPTWGQWDWSRQRMEQKKTITTMGPQQPDKDRKVSYQHFTKASGSWLELLQLQQGEGQAWVQHCDFSLEPPPTSWAFWSGVVDGHGLKSCQVSTQSVFSISKSHVSRLIWTLAFVHPPLGLKFVGFEWIRLFHMLWGFYFYKAFESAFGGPLNSLHILLHTSAHLRILCTGELDFGSAYRE